MFQFLRKLIVPIIVTVLIFFVTMIILEWGFEFSRGDQNRVVEAAAVINGEPVSWQIYNNLYNNLYQQAASKDTSMLSEAQEREIQQRAWGQLVHEKLLAQQAEKNGIEVTDEEVYQYLRANPPMELQQIAEFQTDGKFDYQKYFNAMTSPELGNFWASVEPMVRTDLRKLKMQELVVQAAQVSESDVKDQFLSTTEQVKVGAVFVSFDRFTQKLPTIGDEELKAYYDAHPDEFQVPERATLNIAMIEKTPSDNDWSVAYRKLKAIHDSITAGADFAEMAGKYSDDGSKNDGGNLGWFTRGTMVPEFDRFSFSMKKGEISEPFRTQFGWHIILHNGYKEEKEITPGKSTSEMVKRANVSHILIKVKTSQETLDEAHSRLTAFVSIADKNGFIEGAKTAHFLARSTTPFARGTNIQYIGNDATAGLFAFDHPEGDISGVLENNSAIYVVQVGKKFPAGAATFEESKDKIQIQALRLHVANMCRDTAQAIYSAFQSGTPIEKAAQIHGMTYQEMDPFSRMTMQQPVSGDPKAIGAAFALTEVGQVGAPAEYNQGSVIFKLLERTTPELSEYNAKRDSIYQQILNSRQQQVYSKWYENLMKDSKIENNVEKSQALDQS